MIIKRPQFGDPLNDTRWFDEQNRRLEEVTASRLEGSYSDAAPILCEVVEQGPTPFDGGPPEPDTFTGAKYWVRQILLEATDKIVVDPNTEEITVEEVEETAARVLLDSVGIGGFAHVGYYGHAYNLSESKDSHSVPIGTIVRVRETVIDYNVICPPAEAGQEPDKDCPPLSQHREARPRRVFWHGSATGLADYMLSTFAGFTTGFGGGAWRTSADIVYARKIIGGSPLTLDPTVVQIARPRNLRWSALLSAFPGGVLPVEDNTVSVTSDGVTETWITTPKYMRGQRITVARLTQWPSDSSTTFRPNVIGVDIETGLPDTKGEVIVDLIDTNVEARRWGLVE